MGVISPIDLDFGDKMSNGSQNHGWIKDSFSNETVRLCALILVVLGSGLFVAPDEMKIVIIPFVLVVSAFAIYTSWEDNRRSPTPQTEKDKEEERKENEEEVKELAKRSDSTKAHELMTKYLKLMKHIERDAIRKYIENIGLDSSRISFEMKWGDHRLDGVYKTRDRQYLFNVITTQLMSSEYTALLHTMVKNVIVDAKTKDAPIVFILLSTDVTALGKDVYDESNIIRLREELKELIDEGYLLIPEPIKYTEKSLDEIEEKRRISRV